MEKWFRMNLADRRALVDQVIQANASNLPGWVSLPGAAVAVTMLTSMVFRRLDGFRSLKVEQCGE